MKIIFLILLVTPFIFSQRLGFAIDNTYPITNKQIDIGGGVSFVANYETFPELFVEGKLGYTFTYLYSGWDISANLNYKILENIFITGSLLNHSNNGWCSIHEGTVNKNITMVGLGGSIELTSVFSIELIYYQLFKPVLWYSSRQFDDEIRTKNLNSVIKLNFKFLWEL